MFVVCLSELMFLETSALTGENVEEAFVQCARKILNKIESGRSDRLLLTANPDSGTILSRLDKSGFAPHRTGEAL